MEQRAVRKGYSRMSHDSVTRRVQAEYLEMPGLRLTRRQAQRLFGLDEHACARALDDLVSQHFLVRRPDGFYVRATEGLLHRHKRLRPAS